MRSPCSSPRTNSSEMRLVLASRSPQRGAMLTQLAMPFRVVVSGHDEDLRHGRPGHTVESNARGKARGGPGARRARRGRARSWASTRWSSSTASYSASPRMRRRRHAISPAGRAPAPGAQRPAASTARARGDGERGHGGHIQEAGHHAVARYVACGEWRERAGGVRHPGDRLGPRDARRRRLLERRGAAGRRFCGALDAFGVPPFAWLSRAAARGLRTASAAERAA